MEPTIFETPSGHKVTIKPFLTFPEKRWMQNVVYSAAQVDPQTGLGKIDVSAQIDMQDTMLKILVWRIELTSGKIIDGGEEAVFKGLSEFGDADIVALYDKLDELTKTLDIFPSPDRGKKQVLELFKLHRSGKGQIPEGFEEIYLCELLDLTYTEYTQQPAWWIERKRLWREQQARVKQVAQDEQARKSRPRR